MPASAARFDDAMERSAALHDVLAAEFPHQAAYAVVARVSHALRDADERTRSDAPVRIAIVPAGPSDVPARRAGDARRDRRARRAPRDRGCDVVRRSRDLRARTTVGGARRRSAPRRTRLNSSNRKIPRAVTWTDARPPWSGRRARDACPLDTLRRSEAEYSTPMAPRRSRSPVSCADRQGSRATGGPRAAVQEIK